MKYKTVKWEASEGEAQASFSVNILATAILPHVGVGTEENARTVEV
jgi:hypothetical protein